MKCKNCSKEAKMFWKDAAKTTGQSETFYRDMCAPCYEKIYKKKPLSLYELNEQRKKLK